MAGGGHNKQTSEAMQKQFALEYLIDFNGTQAAIRAGYSAKAAGPILTAAIAARQARAEDSGDEALDMVKAVAEADPNALVEMRRGCCRFCHGQGGQYQFTREEQREAMEKHEKARDKYDLARAGTNLEPYPPFDIKGGIGFNPNSKPNPECTECWGEGVVRTFIKDTRELSAAERRLFAGIKETQHGIELKVNSQDKARELMMRHHGLLNDKLGLGNPDGSAFAGGSPAPMIVQFIDVGDASAFPNVLAVEKKDS
jgi:phage terminase small subunit